jgi:hypothetical protein
VGAQSTKKGFYDEPYRAPPEAGSIEDLRRSLDQLSRRIDITMNRLDHIEALLVAEGTPLWEEP